jgi:hypothetical protein
VLCHLEGVLGAVVVRAPSRDGSSGIQHVYQPNGGELVTFSIKDRDDGEDVASSSLKLRSHTLVGGNGPHLFSAVTVDCKPCRRWQILFKARYILSQLALCIFEFQACCRGRLCEDLPVYYQTSEPYYWQNYSIDLFHTKFYIHRLAQECSYRRNLISGTTFSGKSV